MTAEKYTIPPLKTLEAFTALSDLEQEIIRIVQISEFMLDIRVIASDGIYTVEWKSARINVLVEALWLRAISLEKKYAIAEHAVDEALHFVDEESNGTEGPEEPEEPTVAP